MQLPIVAVADLISGRFCHFFNRFTFLFNVSDIVRLRFITLFSTVRLRFATLVCLSNSNVSIFLPNGLALYSVVRPMKVFGLLFCRYILNVIYPKIIRLPSANFSASRIACQTSCCLLRTRNRNERNS